MCTVPLLLVSSMAVQGAGAIQASQGAEAAGDSQQAYYNYVAAQNKQQADAAIAVGAQKSAISQQTGAIQAMQGMLKAATVGATQKTLESASGVGAGSVTAEDVAKDTMNKANLDQQMIRYNADTASWSAKTGAKYQAWDYENQAALNKVAGANAKRAGQINSQTSLLSGAGSILSTAYKGYQNGAFSGWGSGGSEGVMG